MAQDVWFNLPVKDVVRSREFFTRIGFKLHEREGGGEMVGLELGDKQVLVMMFPEAMFRQFVGQDIADTARQSELLISIGANSREEVDELLRKAEEAGGTVFGRPGGKGWMYGGGFADPDGHRWNVLYMDQSGMPA